MTVQVLAGSVCCEDGVRCNVDEVIIGGYPSGLSCETFFASSQSCTENIGEQCPVTCDQCITSTIAIALGECCDSEEHSMICDVANVPLESGEPSGAR